MSCAVQTDLTLVEATAIIEPYFEAMAERFIEEGGLGRVSKVGVVCDRTVRDAPRHFAGCREDGTLVVAAPELAELPYETVCAILAHELGHAADFLYPAEFVLGRDGWCRRDLSEAEDKQVRRWLQAWQERDHDLVELTADGIAELVLGIPIGYRGDCVLQSFGGSPRPVGLR
jgi:hypothetical protein